MKEAAGEANMTVITIVLIAIVLGVGTLIVNNMMASSENSTACTACGGEWKGGNCIEPGTNSTLDYSACKNAGGTTGTTGTTGTGG